MYINKDIRIFVCQGCKNSGIEYRIDILQNP